VFQLKRKNSSFVFNPMHDFTGGSDGGNPQARVIFGPNGTLYGTTWAGGSSCNGYGCGTVFNLRPPATACTTALCSWTETVLFAFKGWPTDGGQPGYGDLIFDRAGNIYGTTLYGGSWYNDVGTVYELAPSGGGWTETILHIFTGQGSDGSTPVSGVILDLSLTETRYLL
jgi:uncharacterized repeat protein (TIGR03803 family)